MIGIITIKEMNNVTGPDYYYYSSQFEMAEFLMNDNDESTMVLYCLATVISLPLLVFFVYKKVRPCFSVKVNCWFCGENTVVPYGNKNCWDCPYCDQYNGFNEDGDYNKDIPAQHYESLNFPTFGDQTGKHEFNSSNVLCSECNFNQQVKVKLLSEFVPFDESKFDEEVAYYQRYLEKTYGICWECKLRVEKELIDQDAKLSLMVPDYGLIKSKEKAVSHAKFTKSNSLSIGIHGLSLITIVSAAILLIMSAIELKHDIDLEAKSRVQQHHEYFPSGITIALTGMFAEVGAVLCAGKHRLRAINAVSGLLLTALQSLYSPLVIGFFFAPHLHVWRTVLALAALFASLGSAFMRTHSSVNTPSIRATSKFKSSSPSQKSLNSRDQVGSSDTLPPNKLSEIQASNLKKNDPLSASMSEIYITTPTKQQGAYERLGKYKRASLSSFRDKSILQPSRLNSKSVTQASWVAGGYWSNPRTKAEDAELLMNDRWSWKGLLTPPPSVNSSQESQNMSPTASMCGDDVRSIFSEPVMQRRPAVPSIRTWPPSINRMNGSPYWNGEHDSFCHCCHCHPSPSCASSSVKSSPVTVQRHWHPVVAPSESSQIIYPGTSVQNYSWQQIMGWMVMIFSGTVNLALLAYFVLHVGQH